MVAAAAVLVLTGCGSEAPRSTYTPTVTVAPTTAPSDDGSTTTTSTPTVAPTPPDPTPTRASADPDRPKGQCRDSDLGVSIEVDQDGGGAGSSDHLVLFTNTGGESCVLRGAPGVSVVAGDAGDQVGPPADRTQSGAETVRLGVGGGATARLRITNIQPNGGPLDGCTVQHGRGYRVYPPHSTRAFFVEDSRAVACAGSGPVFMSVDVVRPQ